MRRVVRVLVAVAMSSLTITGAVAAVDQAETGSAITADPLCC